MSSAIVSSIMGCFSSGEQSIALAAGLEGRIAAASGGGGNEATSGGGRGRVHQGGYWKAGAANLSASGRLTPSLSATCLAWGPVLTFVLPYAHSCLIIHISTF